MSSKDANLLKLINASGFLFQLKVEQVITSTQAEHGKKVLAREHQWADLENEQEGFIDLITTAGTNGKIVIECKRVREAEWVFLVPHKAKKTRNACVIWTRKFADDKHGAAWDEFSFDPDSLEAEFCIVRGSSEKQQPMLERISAKLIRSVEALASEELSYERPIGRTGLRFYFPVIVTTATLFVCYVQPSDIDLLSGDLNTASFEEVPFLRFTKTMPSSLKSSRSPSMLAESTKESRRTVFIVSAGNLVQFLSGKWEFNLPPGGGSWPWDLPLWREDN